MVPLYTLVPYATDGDRVRVDPYILVSFFVEWCWLDRFFLEDSEWAAKVTGAPEARGGRVCLYYEEC